MKGEITVPIPGELDAVDMNGIVASAAAIYDYLRKKNQEDINKELYEKIENVGGGGLSDEQVQKKIEAALSALAAIESGLSTDGKVMVEIAQSNGKITNVTVNTDDIASASETNQKIANANNAASAAAATANEAADSASNAAAVANQAKQSVEDEVRARKDSDDALESKIEGQNSKIAEQDTKIEQQNRNIEQQNVNIDAKFDAQDESIEEKFRNQEALINEKQLEIGAAETDTIPTEGSGHLITSGGVHTALKEIAYNESNPEYVKVITDELGRILFGIKKDGSVDWAVGVPAPVRKYMAEVLADSTEDLEDALSRKVDGEYVDNPEWIKVIVDAQGKILNGIRTNGSVYIANLEDVDNEFGEAVTRLEALIKENSEAFSVIDDIEERTEISLDAEGKIISWRDKKGVNHENAAEFNHLMLTEDGMNEFQQALKDNGFTPGGGGDYTDKPFMQIPIPRLAFVNITNSANNAVWPTSKTSNSKYYLEFYDGNGNYFKKEVIFSAQGNSSMGFEKKNGKADFCNNNGWDDDDTFEMKFGDWVAQDSFHFKAFHTDFLRGSSMIAYQLADEVYKTRGVYADRPWKKELIDFDSVLDQIPAGYSKEGISDVSLQMDNGARCMPDGFPAIFYLNGEFYGIYAWALSKNRKNYQLNKKTAEHIHLDGDLTVANLWGGTINWTAFEIRNPKDLYCMDGSKYDGDNPSELIDDTSEHYSASNKDHVKTAKVKKYIIDLSKKMSELKTLEVIETSRDGYPTVNLGSYVGEYDASKTYYRWQWVISENKYYMSLHDANTKPLDNREYWQDITSDISNIKNTIEKFFDIDNLVDYQLINMACGDTDGFGKNWQWVTYDGIKWYCCQYDKDMAFGNFWTGMYTVAPKNGWINSNVNMPSGLAIKYYQEEHKTRWKELVEAGLFAAEHIKTLVADWVSRIGASYFEKEWDKWPDAPCNRDSNIDFENWQFDGASKLGETTDYSVWNEESSYNEGDVVWFKTLDVAEGMSWHLRFKAVKANTNKPCLEDYYSRYPKSMGYHDSVWRYYKYIEKIISNQNSFINSL